MASTQLSPSATAPAHRLRSGTAARLAGLPATTLRVWERRYGVGATLRTDSGQRVYTQHDVARLRLLRQLTLGGHAIGTIAALDLDGLLALAGSAPALADVPGQLPGVVVVGRAAAHLLEAVPGCALLAVHEELEQAWSAAPPAAPVDLLLLRVATLQPASVDRLLELSARLRARRVFVVVAFATEASERSLTDAGITVRHEPIASSELGQWLRRAARPQAPVVAEVPARRFDDGQLAQLADMRSPVACECTRHMACLVVQLEAFERYSRECVSVSAEDAALHRVLSRTAGLARATFEQALQEVLDARPGAGTG